MYLIEEGKENERDAEKGTAKGSTTLGRPIIVWAWTGKTGGVHAHQVKCKSSGDPGIATRIVHRDVPPVTSSQQFLDDLATHLRVTTRFTVPSNLKEHFSFTELLCPHCPTDAPFGTLGGAGRPGRGSDTGPLCHGAGSLWLAAARAERTVQGR